MATTDKTRLNGQYRRSKPTTLAEQPQCTSQTSTSGPLIRRRVIIHVEDHTPQANRQATNKQTIPHTPRDIMTFAPHKKNPKLLMFSSLSIPHYLHPSAEQSVLSKNKYHGQPILTTTQLPLSFINSSHPGTQRTKASTTWIVARLHQRYPSTSSAIHDPRYQGNL